MKHKRFVILKVIIVIALILFAGIAYYWFTSRQLVTTNYTIQTGVEEAVRIVQLTDLHNAEFGEENCELVESVKEQNPDIIVMTGDMINGEDEDLSIIKSLISALSEIAPIYYGLGNHEVTWKENWQIDLEEELSSAGATVVDNDYLDTEIKGQKVRIGGYMGYYRQPGMFPVSDEQRAAELTFADDFENTDRFKILLNHIPTQWVDWDYIDKYSIDIIFSGHYHGGMIRIPFIDRGVYAPYIGLFPENTKGVYEGTEATCVLSAGLGTEHSVPRLNNPPEIVVTDLVP